MHTRIYSRYSFKKIPMKNMYKLLSFPVSWLFIQIHAHTHICTPSYTHIIISYDTCLLAWRSYLNDSSSKIFFNKEHSIDSIFID